MTEIEKAEAVEELENIIERLERHQIEMDEIKTIIKDIYAEAKGKGFNPKAIKAVLKYKNGDKEAFNALEEDVDLYKVRLKLA